MPDYKRKHRSRFKTAPKLNKKRIKKQESQDIKMTPQNSKSQPKTNMRVVTGKKLEQKRRFKLFSKAFTVVLVILLFCQLLMPAGIIENASNFIAAFGGGSYPIELESNDTVNTVVKGNYYYILTDTKINAFSKEGKLIYSYAHGFENPVLKTSSTRALVFDQGSNNAMIFTLNNLKSNISIKEKIINANIAENGTYALVTTSQSYVAKVSVYKKNDQLIYEWFSSDDLVNNVAISPTGKKIAVTTLTSKTGQYSSKVLVLSFKSATPIYKKEYDNTLITAIDSSNSGGFSVITPECYNFISWSKFKIREYKNEYRATMFRSSKSGLIIVYNRKNDKTDNRIVVLSKKGKFKKEIKFKGIITDIALFSGQVYCISDTKAYIINEDGKALRSADCGFGVARMVVLGQNVIAAITDNEINKIKLK